MTMGWGVLVVALWMGLIAGAVSTAHADPGGDKSTTQSTNDSDKTTKQRDKAARLGPRKDKTRRTDDGASRQRPRLSGPKSVSGTLPTPSEVRDAVDELGAQVRTTVTRLTDRASNIRTAQSLPRPKAATKRDAPKLPEVTDATAADKAVPDIADS